MKTSVQSALGAVGWLVLCFAAAGIGSLFIPGQWYEGLTKPVWNPPSWLFGPVWTVLYGMMAIAAWLVWKRYGLAGAALPLAALLSYSLFSTPGGPGCSLDCIDQTLRSLKSSFFGSPSWSPWSCSGDWNEWLAFYWYRTSPG